MTSPYITEAMRACRLPIRLWTSSDGSISVMHAASFTGLVHYPEQTKQATRAYVALRDRLLSEEMK